MVLGLCALACADEPGPARRVVLVSLDTLRADRLPLYGYGRDTAPELGRLAAAEGVVFERCYSQSSWTLPSHMSILTGLYPVAHGVDTAEERLSAGVVTLAERLREAGFATAAFTDGGYVSAGWGLEDGFDVYRDDVPGEAEGDFGLARILPQAERWLRGNRHRDTFLFLHTYEVHAPYQRAEPWTSTFAGDAVVGPEDAERMAYLRSLADSSEYELERYQGLQQLEAAYDGMILHADHQLGRLFAMLRALDGWDETLLVVTSDHGESFLDQGLYVGHGLLLTEAETRVPLVVRFPGGRFAGARHPGLVESVDIAPTVLAALGVDAGDFVGQGHDLGALLAGGEDPSEHSISFGGGLQGFAVRDARWTLYHALADEAVERAALERLEPDDPERLRGRLPLGARLEPAGAIDAPNQIAEHAEVEARLREAYRAWEFAQYMLIHERGAPELRGELDPRELERLRELGYL